ncbi:MULTISPECIES: VacJ family lipoprotein [unclassified Acidovorax]|uniref:MlaA family lipoprotein n=1 Tax=unclassified Acidovorax TaxID=2684926 RepID=UPI0024E0E3B1|nr:MULTISPECIES: VacJ family lipoprotein [Comamonadaceae]WOI43978.1 VacJ family lipoprotein [Paracidovorax avenae]
MTTTTTMKRALAHGSALALGALFLTGCASGPGANPRDPLEPYNRSMTNFNDNVDSIILRPVATAYRDITPAPVRTGVSNFFSNLGDAWSFVNNLLQLRGEGALNSLVRFNVNTVFGLGGVFDVASEMGVDRAKQDFGLTLGHWGIPTGPYLVLPLLGPSTVRDTLALPVDAKGDLVSYVDPVSARNSLYALRVVNIRSNLLRASSVLDTAALDKYSFTRDVFLQVRSQEGGAPANSGEEEYDDGGGKLPEEPAR